MYSTSAFDRKSAVISSLEPYGFKEENSFHVLQREFMEGRFIAVIKIDSHGQPSVDVLDADTGEEYLPIYTAFPTGSYVAEVREELEKILTEVSENCFRRELFLFPQTNRIIKLAKEKYGEVPDYPFATRIEFGVLRYPATRKWYALVMNIRKNTLTKGSNDEKIIEVVNLKADTEKIRELIEIEGIYPGYHMKHSSWISVVLDDTLPDEFIMQLIDDSRNFAVSSSSRFQTNRTRKSWIVPANPKYYDIDTAFKQINDVAWKQSSSIHVNDIVYMYVGSPVSAIRYKCLVKEVSIPYHFKNRKLSMSYIMKMDVLKEYPRELCPFKKLNELGIKAVRGPRLANDEFLEFMEDSELKML